MIRPSLGSATEVMYAEEQDYACGRVCALLCVVVQLPLSSVTVFLCTGFSLGSAASA